VILKKEAGSYYSPMQNYIGESPYDYCR